jgi:hypothetical protein
MRLAAWAALALFAGALAVNRLPGRRSGRRRKRARRALERLHGESPAIEGAAELVVWVVAPPVDPSRWTVTHSGLSPDTAGDIAALARDLSTDAEAEGVFQAKLLRELFGPLPFRAVEVNPSWLTANGGVVGHLARRAYDTYDFEALPVLADALEEAGCEQSDILRHCRQAGQHAIGCWVLDYLLGKG